MGTMQYTDKFKAEVVRQVIEHGRSVREVSTRSGVSIDSMYAWVWQHRKAPVEGRADAGLAAGNRPLQAEVKRLIEERDIRERPRRDPG